MNPLLRHLALLCLPTLVGGMLAWQGWRMAETARRQAEGLRLEWQALHAERMQAEAEAESQRTALTAWAAPLPEAEALARQLANIRESAAIPRVAHTWETETLAAAGGALVVGKMALALELTHEEELLALLEALAHPSLRVRACDLRRMSPDLPSEPIQPGPNLAAQCRLEWMAWQAQAVAGAPTASGATP
ncbi:MAG: hypothetical protein LBO00_06035 [Zoogloeaceae bacterium]|nr:hypothetical protein [Zoogloeaceae bacterium]